MNWKSWVTAVFTVALALCLTACGVQITGISLPESLELEAGASETLAVEYTTEKAVDEAKLDEAAGKLTLVWTSSDEAVATVDAEGVVTAVAEGETDITAATEDGKLSASCHVTVGVGVTGVDAPETLELQLGEMETAELGASVLPEAATDVTLTYESSDEQVATVGEDGTVTAVGEGECTITIKAAGFGDTVAETTTKVTVLAAEKEQTAGGSGSKTTTTTKPTGNTGSTAAGGTASGGNTGSTGSAPAGGSSTGGGNNTGNTGNTPTPAPPAPEGGGIGGDLNQVIPGGGTTDGNGGDAEQTEPPIAPPPALEGGGIGQGNVTIPGGGTTDGNGGDAEYGGRPVA